MKNTDFITSSQLTDTAEALIQQGISVIPVYGDGHPTQPKKPATQWGKFQKRLANPYEIRSWFSDDITALGIVCGKISNLTVIDFDDHLAYMRFCDRFPHLLHTFTVKTQRGIHLYYETHQYIASYHFDGGDIKGEKSYVIAPPSCINGYTYTVTKNLPNKALSPHQVDDILNYLQLTQFSHGGQYIKPSDTLLDLKQIYDGLASQLGRNNALYRTASIARDHGVTRHDAENKLIYHHVVQPAPSQHTHETPHDRFLEGQRTIRSAYSTHARSYPTTSGLPNSIREYLLKFQRSTSLVRLLDIFHLADWKPNKYFFLSDAINLGKRYGLNRKSILNVLTGSLSYYKDQHIIVRSNVEYPDNRGLNSCGRGRRAKIVFQVPTVSHLLSVLKVGWSPSDIIQKSDVKDAHSYRLALHREYIKRLSPQVPINWLAKRLGVDARTIRRYNRELNVQKTQNLGCFTLSKTNLDTLPKRHQNIPKNATNGFWLETEDGKRYPAWRHIGSQLLKLRQSSVTVFVQKPSKLALSDKQITPEETVLHSITPAQFVSLQAYRACVDDKPKLTQVVDNLFQYVKKRVKRVSYLNFKLHFDSVINYIAKDDVAETITSYLYAYDDDGNRVRRPAKRGIAYRMLKEFGDGNVYFALLDLHTEVWYSLACHAMRFGQLPTAMKFLLSALE